MSYIHEGKNLSLETTYQSIQRSDLIKTSDSHFKYVQKKNIFKLLFRLWKTSTQYNYVYMHIDNKND